MEGCHFRPCIFGDLYLKKQFLSKLQINYQICQCSPLKIASRCDFGVELEFQGPLRYRIGIVVKLAPWLESFGCHRREEAVPLQVVIIEQAWRVLPLEEKVTYNTCRRRISLRSHFFQVKSRVSAYPAVLAVSEDSWCWSPCEGDSNFVWTSV